MYIKYNKHKLCIDEICKNDKDAVDFKSKHTDRKTD